MIKKRGYRHIVIAAVLAGALGLAGCGKKNVDYELEQTSNSTVENQAGTTNGTSGNGPLEDGKSEDDTNIQVSKEDSIGGISRDLGIPTCVNQELDTEGTNFDKILLEDDSIRVPKRDNMYTALFKDQTIDADFKKMIAEELFDTENGIFVYPYDEHTRIADDAVPMSEIEAIFDSGEAAGNYEVDRYIGKINGKIYTIFFQPGDMEIAPSFYVNLVYDDTITDEMKENYISMHYFERSELSDYYYLDDASKSEQVNDNMSSMDLQQAMDKAREFLYNIGIEDAMVERVSTLVWNATTDSGYSISQEFNGWYVDLIPAVDEQPVYQPDAFGIDVLLYNRILYYTQKTKYTVTFKDEGLVSLSVEKPMDRTDDTQKADGLISWDEALAALQDAIPEVYKDYEGYRVIKFNDIRLTYFPVLDGDENKIIPVYVFAQLDTMEEIRDDWPIQLMMINALDGSYVDIVQDEGLKNIKGDDFNDSFFNNRDDADETGK